MMLDGSDVIKLLTTEGIGDVNLNAEEIFSAVVVVAAAVVLAVVIVVVGVGVDAGVGVGVGVGVVVGAVLLRKGVECWR